MLVEFFGLPGSGKSTLSKKVAALLTKQGVTVREATHTLNNETGKLSRVVRKASHIVRYVIARPRAAIRTTLQIYRTRQQSLGDVVRICCNSLFVRSVTARYQYADAVVLIDEGIAQALWSIGLRAQSQEWLNLVLRDETLKGGPDMLVFVQAGQAAIKGRLAGRRQKVSRLEDMLDRTTFEPQFSMSRRILEQLRSRHVKIISVNNNTIDQIDMNAKIITEELIAQYLSSKKLLVSCYSTIRHEEDR